MDFYCRGGSIFPPPTTFLERPRTPPAPPTHQLRETGHLFTTPSSSDSETINEPEQEKVQHRLKIPTFLRSKGSKKSKRRRHEVETDVEHQAQLDADRMFVAKRQRNLGRDREREYLTRKEAERQDVERSQISPLQEYMPVVVDMTGPLHPQPSRNHHGERRNLYSWNSKTSHTARVYQPFFTSSLFNTLVISENPDRSEYLGRDSV